MDNPINIFNFIKEKTGKQIPKIVTAIYDPKSKLYDKYSGNRILKTIGYSYNMLDGSEDEYQDLQDYCEDGNFEQAVDELYMYRLRDLARGTLFTNIRNEKLLEFGKQKIAHNIVGDDGFVLGALMFKDNILINFIFPMLIDSDGYFIDDLMYLDDKANIIFKYSKEKLLAKLYDIEGSSIL